MKKRITIAIVTSAIAGTMMVTPAFAANTESAHTDLSLYIANDPVYTVTVPETVSLDAKEHTQVPITASDVQYIPEGKKISVTFQKGTSGDFKSGALEKQIKGMELAAFTEDGTVNYEMYPCSQDYPQYEGQEGSNLAIQKSVHYSAYVDYGIALEDIQ